MLTIITALWHRLIASTKPVERIAPLLLCDDISEQVTRPVDALRSMYDTEPEVAAISLEDEGHTKILPRIRRPHHPHRDELPCNAFARDQHRATQQSA